MLNLMVLGLFFVMLLVTVTTTTLKIDARVSRPQTPLTCLDIKGKWKGLTDPPFL